MGIAGVEVNCFELFSIRVAAEELMDYLQSSTRSPAVVGVPLVQHVRNASEGLVLGHVLLKEQDEKGIYERCFLPREHLWTLKNPYRTSMIRYMLSC